MKNQKAWPRCSERPNHRVDIHMHTQAWMSNCTKGSQFTSIDFRVTQLDHNHSVMVASLREVLWAFGPEDSNLAHPKKVTWLCRLGIWTEPPRKNYRVLFLSEWEALPSRHGSPQISKVGEKRIQSTQSKAFSSCLDGASSVNCHFKQDNITNPHIQVFLTPGLRPRDPWVSGYLPTFKAPPRGLCECSGCKT